MNLLDGEITVKNYAPASGDFGIQLLDLPPLPVGGATNVGGNATVLEPYTPPTLAGGMVADRTSHTDDTLWGDHDPLIGLVSPQYNAVLGQGGDDFIGSHFYWWSSPFAAALPSVYSMVLDGGAGADVLFASHDNDTPPLDAPGITIYGDGLNAVLTFDGANDVIYGSPMHDAIYAGPGHDSRLLHRRRSKTNIFRKIQNIRCTHAALPLAA